MKTYQIYKQQTKNPTRQPINQDNYVQSLSAYVSQPLHAILVFNLYTIIPSWNKPRAGQPMALKSWEGSEKVQWNFWESHD